MKRVYLDHNSTTPLLPEVEAYWEECRARQLGNPSSPHTSGRAARDLIDRARERVAGALGVHEDEVLFTSGGTESNNLALRGALTAARASHLVTTAVEHSSVLEAARALEKDGCVLEVLPVDGGGRVDLAALEAALEAAGGPTLVSIQTANNEIGAIQPMAEVADLVRAHAEAILHTDAVQALGRIRPPLAVAEGPDLASYSAHKAGGPIGVGVLFRKRSVRLAPLLHGGGQEEGLRPGTENAAAIAAAAFAVEIAVANTETFGERARAFVKVLWNELRDAFPNVRRMGPEEDAARLPNTLALVFPGTDGKVLVTALDVAGLEVSAGSACASGSIEPSHVLVALGCDDDEARAGIRLSLGWNTTREDCAHAVDTLRKVASASRASRGAFGAL